MRRPRSSSSGSRAGQSHAGWCEAGAAVRAGRPLAWARRWPSPVSANDCAVLPDWAGDTAECLDPDDVRVAGVRGKQLVPGALAPGLELPDLGPFQCWSSSTCRIGVEWGEAHLVSSMGGCILTLRAGAPAGRHPKVHIRWNIAGGRLLAPSCWCPPTPVSGNQAQLARPGGRFGPAGRAELGEDVADVFFGGVEGDGEVAGDALIGPPRCKQP